MLREELQQSQSTVEQLRLEVSVSQIKNLLQLFLNTGTRDIPKY